MYIESSASDEGKIKDERAKIKDQEIIEDQ